MSDYATHLRASNNKRGRPYAEKTVTAYTKAARTLDRWLSTSPQVSAAQADISAAQRAGVAQPTSFLECDAPALNLFFRAHYDGGKGDRQGGTHTLQRNLRPFFIKWLEAEYDHENPYNDARLQSYAHPEDVRPQTLSVEFIRDLLQVTGGGNPRVLAFEKVRDHAIVRVLTEGLRAEELLSLRLDHLHLDQGLIGPVTPLKEARASGEGRIIPLRPRTVVAITRYLRARESHRRANPNSPDYTEWLWLGTRDRDRLTYSGLYRMLNRRAADAGYGNPDNPDSKSIVHPHQFRHTTVDDLLSAGVSEGDVMTIAGWKDPTMLRRYAADMAATRAVNAVKRMGDRY
ncbi:tyrosine-type recombinase/integrase [Streptomyces sp. KMM 9044]|uniref:tyrosine-type recombinase/integrase n=1 Tax=Streptomyces sp. KMM 9044 TaxID=2744474 RepID=UPI002151E2B5|nr:site-specific integrase [Streptomyces sp. KMM 9044]WAX79961.1 site-specific integrase [Streptomyces sp. KMM 9044]